MLKFLIIYIVLTSQGIQIILLDEIEHAYIFVIKN